MASSVCVPNYDHQNGRWQTAAAAAGMGEVRGGGRWQPPMVVDSVSCRQLYLRSAYTFSKKESVPEKTIKCFGMVRKTVAAAAAGKKSSKSAVTGSRRKRRFPVVVKKLYGCAVSTLFQRVLTCTAGVEVVDHMH
ncbi:PREDICTED: uncharacterized protein LOC109155657 [Ipomoea nil]|uniref:uncharacterized protein LOC109155657 n=1 Tax=Ipomoea nil TaxID=35883 RepID=UPI000901A5AC|nr:PREDICTED: uncharacterized protein LOC109155657 [Ipomoea nil]